VLYIVAGFHGLLILIPGPARLLTRWPAAFWALS
jgi:hypothetical protein